MRLVGASPGARSVVTRPEVHVDFDAARAALADARNGAQRFHIEDRGYLTLCWMWTGARMKNSNGKHYGFGKRRGRWYLAHRLAYESGVGSIAEGLTIDHLCRVPLCCNPEHLEAVTIQENLRRAHVQDGWAVCPHGPKAKRYVSGRCVACTKEYDRKRYQPRQRAKKYRSHCA